MYALTSEGIRIPHGNLRIDACTRYRPRAFEFHMGIYELTHVRVNVRKLYSPHLR